MNNNTRALPAFLACALTACAAQPQGPVNERLDQGTGTTTQVLDRPVELLVEGSRGALNDPFAYLGPFETNRMGEREVYLWVAAPQGDSPLALPQLECDSQPLPAAAFAGNLSELGLTQPPYAQPAPWSAQWYFRLPAAAVECLGTARELAVVTRDAAGQRRRYSAAAEAFPSLAAFRAAVAWEGDASFREARGQR